MKSGFGSGKATIVPSHTFAVSEKTSFERKKSPTQQINTNIPLRSKYRRIQETLLAASEINGGSKENRQPAIDGLFLTVDRYASVETCMKYLGSSTKLRDASVLLHKKHVSKFEASQENVTRSLSMLYAGGLLSKRKYAQNRSALSTFSTGNVTEKGYLQRKRLLFSGGIPIPKILPYKDLMHIVNNVDIGELLPVANLCSHLPSEDKVDGVYRNLETLLVSLAKFYLDTDCYRKPEDRLRWFGGEFGHFRVAVGGDGAPFGKWDESVSWLVSFLNVGPRIASPNDNFLLFGANCKETDEVVVQFCKLLAKECAEIEQRTYTIGDDVTVKFTFDLVPSDMKFLAFINGEISNSACYFSSFANACNTDLNCLEGQFGTDPNCKWKPWRYTERVSNAKKVASFKAKLAKNSKCAAATNRSKVTQYIASIKCRQEFEPPIGVLCEKEIIEPLHLKNNAVQKLHSQMLLLALADSGLSNKITSVADMPNCSAKRYLHALEHEVKATRLKKQLVKWLVDERVKNKPFSYRFTGKDSQLVLGGFMYLISAIRGDRNCHKLLGKLLIIVFIAIRLRDCVSLFSKYHFCEQDLQQLFLCCSEYFTAKVLFCDALSPSEWSIGKVVPVHAQWMFERYRAGLGINTMQGREAKHVHIASYAKHSNIKNRWSLVFRHDYISKVWLPLQQPSLLTYHRTKESLVPKRVEDDILFCYCGFPKGTVTGKCFYCDHELTAEIVTSVKCCKITGKLSSTLK